MNYCYDLHCATCPLFISEHIHQNSVNQFGLPLCPSCQSWYNNLKVKPTACAKKLFLHLKARGIKAVMEAEDKFKTIDIVVEDALVCIEVDGSHHNLIASRAINDLWRTYYSMKEEYITLHIPNSAVRHDVETTAKIISRILIERKKQLKRLKELRLMQLKNAQQKLFDLLSPFIDVAHSHGR